MTMTQPSGEQIQLYQVGDEYGHFFRTPDGHAVIFDNNAYYYADVEGGKPISSAILVHDQGKRTIQENAFVEQVDDEAVINAFSARRRTSVAQSGLGTKGSTAFPTTGSPKAIVILVEFTDCKFTDNVSRFKNTTPNAYVTDMLNKSGFDLDGAYGSAYDYFKSASNGVFTPQFDVYGPYTLSHATSYYGEDSGSTHDTNKAQLIKDACSAANSDINFSNYKYSGSVPFVYVIYAGIGQNLSGVTTDIWPAASTLGSYYDAVKVDRYACSNAINSNYIPMGIGSFIHEFSHILGLPDLYSGSLTVTPGNWSVMDAGTYLNDSRCPAGYGAYERNALKWIDPKVISGDDEVSLKSIALSNSCGIVQTSTTNEFFLLENRQKDSWDMYLPGHGLLVWHIDYDSSAFSSGPNSTETHQRVDIVEANGNPDRSSTTAQAGYTFPGTSGVTSYTPTDWNGNTYSKLSNITESNRVISFSVGNGIPFVHNTITANAAADVTTNSFTASWTEVDGATGYCLTVKKGNDTGTVVDTNNAGSNTYSVTIPDGWGTYNIDKSTLFSAKDYDSSYYGSASPAYRFNNGNYITSATYTRDVTKIKFWYRGVNTTNSILSVWGHIGDSWVKIDDITVNNSTGITKTYTSSDKIPAGVNSVKFSFADNDNGGALALDDIEITSGTVATIVGDYDNKNVGNVTEYSITDLDPSEYYTYYVSATNGSYNTPDSNTVSLTTLSESESGGETGGESGGDGEDNTESLFPDYGIPSGSTTANVFLKKIETQEADVNNHTYSWSSAPDDLYTLLDPYTGVNQGGQFKIDVDYNFGTNRYYKDEYTNCSWMYIYTDWDRDGKFTLLKQVGAYISSTNSPSDNETALTDNKTITFDVPDDAAKGWSCVRIILNYGYKTTINDTEQGGAVSTDLYRARAYDIPIYVMGEPDYATPSGDTYSANYLTGLTLSGGDSTLTQSWTAHPGQLFNYLDDAVISVQYNSTLNLQLTANSLSDDTSSVHEDMRYDCAYIYTDWNTDGNFELYKQIGSLPPSNNIAGNYATVMNINENIEVPIYANIGRSRIRIIYSNAWSKLNEVANSNSSANKAPAKTATLDYDNSANATNINKGIVYDIPISVYSPVTDVNTVNLYDVEGEPEYYTLQGLKVSVDRLTPGIYIVREGSKVHKIMIQ
jgi:M6 family metalloprotease-like protein